MKNMIFENKAELNEQYLQLQTNALLELTLLAKQEIQEGKGCSPEQVLKKLRDARNKTQ